MGYQFILTLLISGGAGILINESCMVVVLNHHSGGPSTYTCSSSADNKTSSSSVTSPISAGGMFSPIRCLDKKRKDGLPGIGMIGMPAGCRNELNIIFSIEHAVKIFQRVIYLPVMILHGVQPVAISLGNVKWPAGQSGRPRS
jgi:hypothetical protein